MSLTTLFKKPLMTDAIVTEAKRLDFEMESDGNLGMLLRTLVASKPNGRVLELGTGLGLSLSWILDGLDENGYVISIDVESNYIEIARKYFEHDARVELITQDASDWIINYKGAKFDLIFADAWPGKYELLEETIDLLNPNGIYIIDDMIEQINWPEGHQDNVNNLIEKLESKVELTLTKMDWSTGIVIAVKKR
ncbi:SAM-dependent methyltransferase [Croceivirga radicis]|uniref:SAM-dependent methyltransferase n=2 Tax=Croceivirga radicis TaxID=1929488 RepID=A0A1V6LSZ3_9FLAO|nr:SAM-dependent methyltransferase [Croceivirga radicis]